MKTRLGQLVVGTVLAGLLLMLVLHGLDWSAISRSMRSAQPAPLAAVVAVTCAAYWMRAVRWGSLLAPLARVGQFDLFSATMVGYGSSLAVPRSGELLRPWLISRKHPVSTSAGFATIVIERLVDLISVLVLFAVYLFLLPRTVAQADSKLMDAVTFAGGVAAAVAVALLAFLFALHANAERVLPSFERLLARIPPWMAQRLGQVLRSFSDGLAVLRAPYGHWAVISLQSVALWLLTAYSFHLVQIAFGIDLPFQTTFLLVAFLVVGEAIPTPGLIGGFHAFYVLALVEVFGVERGVAVAASIAAHVLTTVPVLLLAAAFFGREGLTLKRLRLAPETRPDPARPP